MNNKVKEVLDSILARFESGDIPKAIAYANFPISNVPSEKWSFTNRLIMHLSNTADARGIRQWNSVGRSVKKGSKAIYILVPRIISLIDRKENDNRDENTHENTNNEQTDNGESSDSQERFTLKGFLAQPVFRVEDTEGKPLDYESEISIPELPLINVARQWGISVSSVSGSARFYGAYFSKRNKIELATPEEIVFFHELSHAAHERVVENLRPGQHWDQEIVAELSAQTLCHVVGKDPGKHLGNSYRYIDTYAKTVGLTPISACLKVIDDVRQVLSLILNWEDLEDQESSISQPDQTQSSDLQIEMEVA